MGPKPVNPHPMGSRIVTLRQTRGFSQADLAKKAGLELKTIQNIERGNTKPHSSTLNIISKALNVEITSITDPDSNELFNDSKISDKISEFIKLLKNGDIAAGQNYMEARSYTNFLKEMLDKKTTMKKI